MRVMGEQAVLDPSRMERAVQKQVDARRETHERANKDRALTPSQKKEKRERKLREDLTTGVSVSVFRVENMSHRYHRTKVDLNAQQFNLTGACVEVGELGGVSVVVVEGGKKSIKKFTRLMTVRMKWTAGEDESDSSSEEEEEEEEEKEKTEEGEGYEAEETEETKTETETPYKQQKFSKENQCRLVWSGTTLQQKFKDFSFLAVNTSSGANKLFTDKGMGDYWALSVGMGVGEEGGGDVLL